MISTKPIVAFVRLVAATLLVMCLSCGPSPFAAEYPDERAAASVVGKAANDALPLLVSHFTAQALAIIEEADSEADARSALAELDRRWDPIWYAHHALELAQHGWADALESGDNTAAALRTLKGAWCLLQRLWPAEVIPMPLQLGECAEVNP